jgi:hypothetical protein
MVWMKEEEFISPEMKSIADQCVVFTFPPGTLLYCKNRFCKILRPEYEDYLKAKSIRFGINLRNALTEATVKD